MDLRELPGDTEVLSLHYCCGARHLLRAGGEGVTCMNIDKLRASSKKDLMELARKKGIEGWHSMRKEDLLEALSASKSPGKSRSTIKTAKASKASSKPTRTKVQTAAARNTNGTGSDEEQVERSKYDVGVPTKDLSA